MERHLLLLNLDAELEFDRPRAYRCSATNRTRVAQAAAALAPSIPPPWFPVVPGLEPPAGFPAPAPALGQAWSPTPSARAAFAQMAVELTPAPTFEILRRVNARSFLRQVERAEDELPAAGWVTGADELELHLARHGSIQAWILKREYAMAGRGHRRVGRGLSASDAKWVAASVKGGQGDNTIRYLRVEPELTIDAEWTHHGRIAASGKIELGQPCVQSCDSRGRWLATRLPARGELAAVDLTDLNHSTARVANALRAEGYFGPFGIDAFHWRQGTRLAGFRPLSEINARFTTGWWCGMGVSR